MNRAVCGRLCPGDTSSGRAAAAAATQVALQPLKEEEKTKKGVMVKVMRGKTARWRQISGLIPADQRQRRQLGRPCALIISTSSSSHTHNQFTAVRERERAAAIATAAAAAAAVAAVEKAAEKKKKKRASKEQRE